MTAPGRSVVAAALCAALAAPTGGCSWLAVKRAPAAPPAPPSERPVDCTRHRDAPIADTTLAVLLFGAGVFVGACPVGRCRDTPGYVTMFAAPAVALVAALSAGYGFRQTARCRALTAQQERWWAAAREPRAGAERFPCRDLAAGGVCDAGLECAAEVCVRPDAADGTEGHACLRVPGTAAVSMCRAGLRCRDGRCVRLAP